MESFYRAALADGSTDDDEQRVSVGIEHWRREFNRVCTADDTEAKKKAFQRARNALVAIGRLAVADDRYSCFALDPGFRVANLLDSHRSGTRDTPGH